MHLDPHLWPPLAFGLILAGGLYLFITEKVRIDVTAMLILLALVLTGVLSDKQALSGFSSEPAIIVAAVFVISGALGATGISEKLGRWVERASGNHEWRTIAVVMPMVLQANRAAIEDRITKAAAYLGFDGGFDGFHDQIMELRALLSIPANLSAMGVQFGDLDMLTEMALEDPSCGGNPIPMTRDYTRTLFDACM